jgi:MinD-like ATPase involved in chromosome partitioning or flagellar assembly
VESLPLLTAVSHRWEADLAGKVGATRLAHVVRRCADLAELVGTAEAGTGRLAVVSVDLRGLDRDTVARLAALGVALLGVHPPGDDDGARTLRRWGVDVVLPADADQDAVEEALRQLATREATTAGGGPPGGSPPEAEAQEPGDDDEPARERGQVVVVWGPQGSPGRTTVAVNLAAELASPVAPVCLVDADTYAASVAQFLAVLDEAPGVLAAARLADQGGLDRSALSRLAPEVLPGLRVLTGLPRGDRWPELADRALADILETTRRLAPWTVVDVAAQLEQDEELSFDTRAPRRNGATLTALDAADHVVAVGTADPVGLHRLVRGLDSLGDVCAAPHTVVVTRVRGTAVGPDPRRRVTEALQRFAGVAEVVLVPEDREAVDAALLEGRTLKELRPGSPAREALGVLAGRVTGEHVPIVRRRAVRWPRLAWSG